MLALVAAAAAVVVAARIGGTSEHDSRRIARGAPRHRAAGGAHVVPMTLTPGAATRPLLRAPVTVTLGRGEVRIPRSYLGLSTEYWAMPAFERQMGQFERMLSMVRVSGNGPLILRIGGDSTDHALYNVNIGRAPKGIFELRQTWFRQASSVVETVDARTLLDLNLVSDLPRMAAQWARAAQAQLPAGTIIGYEVGNEPDLYNPWYWSALFGPIARVLDIRLFPRRLTPETYVALYHSYARVLATFAPGVPLVAPVIAYPTTNLKWISTLLEAPHPALGLISAHMYPYSACASPLSPEYPSIAKILGETATAGMASSLEPAIALAHGAGLPFRLTELNSVTCGGVPGISNTFATALWAPDALFELARAGVDGVNIHVRAFAINAAFAPVKDRLVARPLFYGLVLFTRTLGPDPQLVPLQVESAPPGLKVWGVRVLGNVVHVLLINKGAGSTTVDLRLTLAGAATVQRLLAPSSAARSGVTLDGQHLGPDDTWVGRAATETVRAGAGGYMVPVPGTSAALVTAQLAAGTVSP